MENKYLRDIKELNDNFDEYKRQVEKHIMRANEEKSSLEHRNEEYLQSLNKVKQTLRSNSNHHELNSKRMRDKIVKLENELLEKNDKLKK